MIVRPMMPNEFDITINLFGQYFDEMDQNATYPIAPWDENSVIDFIRKYASQSHLVWLNGYEGQRPVGFIAGSIGPCLWNKNCIKAHISFVYAMPGRSTKELLDAFVEHVQQAGASEIILTDLNSRVNHPLFEQFGFKPVQLMAKEIV